MLSRQRVLDRAPATGDHTQPGTCEHLGPASIWDLRASGTLVPPSRCSRGSFWFWQSERSPQSGRKEGERSLWGWGAEVVPEAAEEGGVQTTGRTPLCQSSGVPCGRRGEAAGNWSRRLHPFRTSPIVNCRWRISPRQVAQQADWKGGTLPSGLCGQWLAAAEFNNSGVARSPSPESRLLAELHEQPAPSHPLPADKQFLPC